jgi:hypothetical protein
MKRPPLSSRRLPGNPGHPGSLRRSAADRDGAHALHLVTRPLERAGAATAAAIAQASVKAELTMHLRHNHATGRTRWTCAAGVILALPLLPLLAGCEHDELEKEFRGAAIGSIETGVDALADGFIDGLFAVLEPETDTTTN